MTRLRKSPMLVAAILLAATIGIAACGDDGGGGGGQATLDLKIGDIVPLTGDLSPYGPPGRKAADLAVEEIKKAIQETGSDHTVTITHEDEETNPQAAVSAARKLADAGVTCMAGAWASADTIPVAESVSIREQIVQISPASTAASIRDIEDDGYLNRTAPPDNLQAKALADRVGDGLGGASGKTVNIAARNDFYGTGLADAFEEEWQAAGGRVGQKVIYDPEQPSYNSEASRITSGNPAGYVIIDFPETYAKVGPALVRTGNWDAAKSFITDGLAATSLPEDAGREATEGLRGTTVGSFSGANQNAFDRLYTAAPGPDRQTFDSQNFDAVMLCYLAAVAAGSDSAEDIKNELIDVTGPPGTKYSFTQLPQAIEALENGDDIDYEGASGPIDLDDTGDLSRYVYTLIQFRNGELREGNQVTPTAEQ